MNRIKERVHESYYDNNINCARTTLKLLTETFGIEIQKQTYDAAIGMHGAGKFGAQCGLVEGALLFIGIFLEGKLSDKEIASICYNYAEEFTNQFDSLSCSELRPGGFNDDDLEHLCEDITVEAIEFTIKFIEDLKVMEVNGGNVNEVIRVGDTIRRLAVIRPYSEELLKYLESKGFSQVPKYLGRDDMNREILSYIEGEVSGNNYPNKPFFMWSDEALEKTAILMKEYHEATIGFVSEEVSDTAYPDTRLHEVICHNDFAPYNIVYEHEETKGIIDFDMAGPGPRLWDIAYALYTSVPLASFQPDIDKGEIVDYNFSYEELRKRRIKLFFKAYGMTIPKDLKRWIIRRIEKLCDTIMAKSIEGNEAFIAMVEEGHLDHYEKEVEFLKKHFPSI